MNMRRIPAYGFVRFFLATFLRFLPLSHFRAVSYGTELDLTVSRCVVLARILVFFRREWVAGISAIPGCK